MRVVTLLPAATEIVAALGEAGSLVGISHECDYPAHVLGLPRVTATPIDPGAPGSVIDAEVRRLHAAGKPVIGVDAELLRRLAPELIVTQDLCEVCAVADGEVYPAGGRSCGRSRRCSRCRAGRSRASWATSAPWQARSAGPPRAGISRTGSRDACGVLRSRQAARRPRVVCVEWLDPLYLAGHWVPELVEAAGGTDVAPLRAATRRGGSGTSVVGLRPDLIVVMLCGFGVRIAPWPSCPRWPTRPRSKCSARCRPG